MVEPEDLLENMRAALSQTEPADAFFQVDNLFHEKISQMGMNPLADKIGRMVRTLTHSMQYHTVKAMITGGRGQELPAAHGRLCLTLKEWDASQIEKLVRDSYFDEVLEGLEPV